MELNITRRSSKETPPSDDFLLTLLNRGEKNVNFKDSLRTKEQTDQKIPDGGWGWVVVFASLMISLIADGISFTFGLLYVEFLNEFGESKSATSWIGSIFLAVPLLTGPIMSAFVERFGCRSMTIVGGLISALGFILSAYVNSITLMCITFGCITGLGLGLCYVTVVVSITYWFDKKRNFAIGWGACGTGIGTFIYPPLTNYFISEYGWRGTLLLLSGLFLNICVFGSLMRDPDWLIEEPRRDSYRSGKSFLNVEELREVLSNDRNNESLLRSLEAYIESPIDFSGHKKRRTSEIDLAIFEKQKEKILLKVLDQPRLNKAIAENNPDLVAQQTISDKGLNKSDCFKLLSSENQTRFAVKNNPFPGRHTQSVSWLRNPTHINLKDTELPKNNVDVYKYHLRASSCPNIYHNSMVTIVKAKMQWCDKILDVFKDTTDFSMFLQLHFALVSVSTILLFTCCVIPFCYLVDAMIIEDYSESDASLIVSSTGITNTIAMIGLGWAGDRPWMNVTKAYGICLILMGCCCASLYICIKSYYLMATMGACFGLFFASNFTYTPIILAQLVELKNFPSAYGLILLCQGIGSLLGPPLGGMLFDITGSWKQSFLQAGVWIGVSGLLILAIPYTKNRKIFGNESAVKEASIV